MSHRLNKGVMIGPQKTFTSEDQERFAALSGDSNPMHMDPVAARRTQAGFPVVHGIHTLLWALDCIAADNPGLPLPTSIRADFTSFLPVGQTAILGPLSTTGNRRATVSVAGLSVMILELRYAAPAGKTQDTTPLASFAAQDPGAPIILDMADMEGQAGSLAFATAGARLDAEFPHACAWLGAVRVAALTCCSRLVGTVCPGLHSIFNRIDAQIVTAPAEQIDYAVTSVDSRFRRVNLAVSGGGIAGSLTTSVRHPPIQQSHISSVAQSVEADAFVGATALVVGGSRGLGELTAKILAAGGARVVITYARGKADAQRVADEITDWGGRCEILLYDACADATEQLGATAEAATHCYYYATPPIFTPSGTLFSRARFETFFKIYVDGFYELCEALRLAADRTVSLYYPSSVAVAERPPGMAEYAMAKAAGELLCDEINLRRKTAKVFVSRLPRLATDQTATLLSEQPVSALDVLLPIVRQVQSAEQP